MISRTEYFDTLTMDNRQWADHTDYWNYGPTRCPLHVPLVRDPKCPLRYVPNKLDARGWAQRSVGCHWTHPAYPQAIVSTFSGPKREGERFSGYVAVVNFSHIGVFATRELAQQAVEAMLGGER